ncbi:hypothetical protein Tco_0972615 [Tanacetum coccineum]
MATKLDSTFASSYIHPFELRSKFPAIKGFVLRLRFPSAVKSKVAVVMRFPIPSGLVRMRPAPDPSTHDDPISESYPWVLGVYFALGEYNERFFWLVDEKIRQYLSFTAVLGL